MAVDLTKTIVGSGVSQRWIGSCEATGTTVNAEVSVLEFDARPYDVLTFYVENTGGANGLTYSIDGDQHSDFSTETEAISANVAAGAYGTIYSEPAGATFHLKYKYYRVTVKSQVGGSHTTYQLHVTAKRY